MNKPEITPYIRVQIISLNPVRTGNSRKTGNPYEMQEAEAMILRSDGSVESVGGLLLPKHLTGDAAPKPGQYDALLGLDTDKERRIGARILDLVPVRAASPASGGVTKSA